MTKHVNPKYMRWIRSFCTLLLVCTVVLIAGCDEPSRQAPCTGDGCSCSENRDCAGDLVCGAGTCMSRCQERGDCADAGTDAGADVVVDRDGEQQAIHVTIGRVIQPVINAKIVIKALAEDKQAARGKTVDDGVMTVEGDALEALSDRRLYSVRVSGGELLGQDGERTQSERKYNAVLTGQELRSGHAHLTYVTEVVYVLLKAQLESGEISVELNGQNAETDALEFRDRAAEALLAEDLTGDDEINYQDVLAFDPERDQKSLAFDSTALTATIRIGGEETTLNVALRSGDPQLVTDVIEKLFAADLEDGIPDFSAVLSPEAGDDDDTSGDDDASDDDMLSDDDASDDDTSGDDPAADGPRPIAVAPGYNHTCVLFADQTVKCAGSNADGELGTGDREDKPGPAVVLAPSGDQPLGNVVAIAAGEFHTCALLADTSVVCWGNNTSGQLGDGEGDEHSLPVYVVDELATPISGVEAVVGGYEHSCALLGDGTVMCWGRNDWEQLGDGTQTNRSAAAFVADGEAPLTGAVALTAGGIHSCALLTDGTAKCWGSERYGRLGSTADPLHTASAPVVVLNPSGDAPLSGIRQLHAGAEHTCALFDDGTGACWGNQSWIVTDSKSGALPQPILQEGGSPLTDISALSLGGHTCALLNDGSAVCFGPTNDAGQLGNGAELSRSGSTNPIAVVAPSGDGALSGIEQLAVGVDSSVAILSSGELLFWGDNSYGEFGHPSRDESYEPLPVLSQSSGAPLTGVRQISGSHTHSCALLNDGSVACWGMDIAQSDTANPHKSLAVTVLTAESGPPLSEITEIAAGNGSTCAQSTNSVLCWGAGFDDFPGAVLVADGVPLSDVQRLSRLGSTCATRLDGTGVCWGDDPTNRLLASTLLDGAEQPLTNLSAVEGSCVLQDSQVLCWGDNTWGQLGDGTTSTRQTPAPVLNESGDAPLSGVRAIAPRSRSSCALLETGRVMCWGSAERGQLGNGGTADSPLPVTVSSEDDSGALEGVVDLAAAAQHACALLEDGTAKCWGENGIGGWLGDGSYSDRRLPVTVRAGAGEEPMVGISAITTGTTHSCALLADGTVLCWGDNGRLALGDGSIFDTGIPFAVDW